MVSFRCSCLGLNKRTLNDPQRQFETVLDGTNPHDSLVKSLPLAASQYCKRLFLLTASYQPVKWYFQITIKGETVDIYKWLSFYTLDQNYFSFKMAMDAVYIRMMDRLLHMNKTFFRFSLEYLRCMYGCFTRGRLTLHSSSPIWPNLYYNDSSTSPSICV